MEGWVGLFLGIDPGPFCTRNTCWWEGYFFSVYSIIFTSFFDDQYQPPTCSTNTILPLSLIRDMVCTYSKTRPGIPVRTGFQAMWKIMHGLTGKAERVTRVSTLMRR